MTVERSSAESRSLAALGAALASWRAGNPELLEAWTRDELDAAGAPARLPLAEWTAALRALAEARPAGHDWPSGLDDRVVDFVRTLLRFSRPGGTTATMDGDPARPRAFWKAIARAFPAGDVGRVLDWWFPGGDADHVPPPLPAWSAADRVLGVLRADWTGRGDLLAFDQRDGETTRFELFGSGVSWLGPSWTAAIGPVEAPARPTAWTTSSTADVAEWSFRSGDQDVARLALLLRGRRLALLADLHGGGDGASMSVDVRDGLSRLPMTTPGATAFRPGKAGKSAQMILMTPGEAEFDEESRRLRLTAAGRWLPLLVSWDHARNRKPLAWVELTVAEDGERCPREVAWAARASWGRSETFVFYRSLAPAARRSFLGCSTTARMLVGRFTPEGDVEPIATLD